MLPSLLAEQHADKWMCFASSKYLTSKSENAWCFAAGCKVARVCTFNRWSRSVHFGT